MGRYIGQFGQGLARLFQFAQGRGLVDDIRAEDGIGLNYDMEHIVGAEAMHITTRGVDSADQLQSQNITLVINQLPLAYRLLAITVTTDAPDRLSEVVIYLDDIGAVAPAGVNSSVLLWRWGQDGIGNSIVQPVPFFNQPDTARGFILIPERDNHLWAAPGNPLYLVNSIGTLLGVGVPAINVTIQTAAFGAGTVRVNARVLLSLPVGPGPASVQKTLPL